MHCFKREVGIGSDLQVVDFEDDIMRMISSWDKLANVDKLLSQLCTGGSLIVTGGSLFLSATILSIKKLLKH